MFSRLKYIVGLVLIVGLGLVSCKKQLSDEELFDRLHGNWAATMKFLEYESFHYEVDSALFYEDGKRLGIVFSSKGNFQKTFEGTVNGTYWVEEGDLVFSTEDSTSFEILLVNHKKLVLQKGEEKHYFEKFVY